MRRAAVAPSPNLNTEQAVLLLTVHALCLIMAEEPLSLAIGKPARISTSALRQQASRMAETPIFMNISLWNF
jgi:hypothetical protein